MRLSKNTFGQCTNFVAGIIFFNLDMYEIILYLKKYKHSTTLVLKRIQNKKGILMNYKKQS